MWNADKFAKDVYNDRAVNGIRYIRGYSNAVISANVKETLDCGTHTVFIADVKEAFILSDEKSASYQYYFDNIKPKQQPPAGSKKGFVCTVCEYIYEADSLPGDIICPLCKHGAKDFRKL